MTKISKVFLALLLSSAALTPALAPKVAMAASAAELNRDGAEALQQLYKTNPFAESLSHNAKAILIFPNIVKAGLIFGGSYGEGEMLQNGAVLHYFNSVGGSWGLQAGAQSYAYAVFLMTDEAVKYVSETAGWELGVGPTIVVVDEGMAKNLSTSTLKDDAYAFIFSQQGLMGGISIEGTKITRVSR